MARWQAKGSGRGGSTGPTEARHADSGRVGRPAPRRAARPRVDRTKKHSLGDILVIGLCAVIAGADSFEGVAAFGRP